MKKIKLLKNPPFDIPEIRHSCYISIAATVGIYIFLFDSIMNNSHLFELIKAYLTIGTISIAIFSILKPSKATVMNLKKSDNIIKKQNAHFPGNALRSFTSSLLSNFMISAFTGLLLFLKDSFSREFQIVLFIFFFITFLFYFLLIFIVSQKLLGNKFHE